MKCIAIIVVAVTLSGMANAEEIVVSSVLPKTGTRTSMHWPPCDEVANQFADNIGQQILKKGIDAVGKAVSELDLSGDPFNTRTKNQSTCVDLCATLPISAKFKAKGSITPFDWLGDLPNGLPQSVDPQNWAGIRGPIIKSSSNFKVVCYTFMNWSHDNDRHVGVQFNY